MAENEALKGEARGDYTIADLRSMMTPKAEPEAKAEPETPAADGEPKAKTAPDSERDDSQAKGETERGADGKFKAKQPKDEPKEDAETSSGVQKRIDKAVKAQREAERRAEELERKLAESQGSRPGEAGKPGDAKPAQQPAAAKKPEAKDFDSYEAYIEALTDWKVEEKESKRAAEQAERAKEEAQRKAAESLRTRVDEAKAKHADWDDVMEEAKSLAITREMNDAIRSGAVSPEVAYHLAKNPDEAKRIAALPAGHQVAAMAKIEARLETPEPKDNPKDSQREKPKVPKPPVQVGGGASARNPKLDDPDISMSEFKRIARAGLTRRE